MMINMRNTNHDSIRITVSYLQELRVMEWIIASHNIDEFEWFYLTVFARFSSPMKRQMRTKIRKWKPNQQQNDWAATKKKNDALIWRSCFRSITSNQEWLYRSGMWSSSSTWRQNANQNHPPLTANLTEFKCDWLFEKFQGNSPTGATSKGMNAHKIFKYSPAYAVIMAKLLDDDPLWWHN